MDINNELDRIRGQGFRIIITWDDELAIVPGTHPFPPGFQAKRTIKRPDEKWEHCIYRAIMNFDEDGI